MSSLLQYLIIPLFSFLNLNSVINITRNLTGEPSLSERSFFFLNFETHLHENMEKTRVYMKLPNQHCGAVGEPITQRSANQTFCCTLLSL